MTAVLGKSLSKLPGFDPRAVPIIDEPQPLPAVPIERLTPAALRSRLGAPPPGWVPETDADRADWIPPRRVPAAVLIGVIERPNELTVLLTERTAHLNDHAGQIAFPGGRRDPGDVDEVDTALREAHEEVGLERRFIEVIGRLPVYSTVTGFEVTPVVGLVRPELNLTLDSFEVAHAFEVPLRWLMDPRWHRRHQAEVDGAKRQFWSMPWRVARNGAAHEYFIWGATAAMLRNFYRLLSA
jgi:8-oxo-dGTP pyrophosphatase MutT (NUDIX family)